MPRGVRQREVELSQRWKEPCLQGFTGGAGAFEAPYASNFFNFRAVSAVPRSELL